MTLPSSRTSIKAPDVEDWSGLAEQYCGLTPIEQDQMWSSEPRARDYRFASAMLERATGLQTTNRLSARCAARLVMALACRYCREARSKRCLAAERIAFDLAGAASLAMVEGSLLRQDPAAAQSQLAAAEVFLENGSGDAYLLADLLTAKGLVADSRGDAVGCLKWFCQAETLLTEAVEPRRLARVLRRKARKLEGLGQPVLAARARKEADEIDAPLTAPARS